MAGPQRVDLLGVQMSDQQDYWMDWVLTSRKQRAQRTFQKKKVRIIKPPSSLGDHTCSVAWEPGWGLSGLLPWVEYNGPPCAPPPVTGDCQQGSFKRQLPSLHQFREAEA